MKYWPSGLARGAEIVVGLTYVIAAVLKGLDFNGFLPQIFAYQIVESNAALLTVAFTALALETGLGVCMVLGAPYRRVVLGLGAAMLCFFSLVILYAWQVHGLEDCGCFGKVKFTPPQAIGKNLVLLALTALAYYGLVHRNDPPQVVRGGAIRGGLGLAAAVLLCLGVVPQLISVPTVGASPAGGETPTTEGPDLATTPSDSPAGPFASYAFSTEFGDAVDLSQGEYLVALLSMECTHCMDSVPQLNEFVFDATLPPLVAICLEPSEGSMEEFKMVTQPQFPMHSLGDKSLKLFALLEHDNSPPRLVYVRDGRTVVSWDEDVPDFQTLSTGLAEAGFGGGAKTE